MKLLALLGIGIALAAGNETVWWRTDSGTVVGFGDSKQCSLVLYDHDHNNAVVFSWSREAKSIAVMDQRLQFADGQAVPMTVQIGATPLGTIGGIVSKDYVSGVLTQEVEPLLVSAKDITFHVANVSVEATINRAKIGALLDGVKKCRTNQR